MTDTDRLDFLISLFDGVKWADAGPLWFLKPEDEKYISKSMLKDIIDSEIAKTRIVADSLGKQNEGSNPCGEVPLGILGFSGEYRWLSNFWPVSVVLDGQSYPSVEHAYQAAKTTPDNRLVFHERGISAGEAKKLGKGLSYDKEAWKLRSEGVMLDLLRQKFSAKHPQLHRQLLETGNAYIEETNYWGDTFWGVCRGAGDNRLGKLIMQVRKELRDAAPKIQDCIMSEAQ